MDYQQLNSKTNIKSRQSVVIVWTDSGTNLLIILIFFLFLLNYPCRMFSDNPIRAIEPEAFNISFPDDKPMAM